MNDQTFVRYFTTKIVIKVTGLNFFSYKVKIKKMSLKIKII